LADGVEVLALVLPEVEFLHRRWVVSIVKSMGPENISMSCDAPSMEKEGKGKKSILIVKTVAVTDPKGAPFPNGIDKDVVFMELNKPILDNLLAIC
jgi:hypothetical protein